MNYDTLGWKPNQNADHRPEECTAYTVADIVGNITNQQIDPGFGYGSTFHLTGQTPGDSGLDAVDAFTAQTIYGSLPTEDQPFTALQTSEAMEANFDAYPVSDKQLAATLALKGIKELYSFDDIVAYQNKMKWSVGVTMTFYESFLTTKPDGTLPEPAGDYTEHEVVVWGLDPRGLIIKAWLGPTWGENGYGYVPMPLFDDMAQVITAFDPNAWKWWTLATAALKYGIGNKTVMNDILTLLYANKS